MKEDSLVFAYHNGKPVGFIMWYPDWNELAAPGEAFGTKHFFLNLLKGKSIRTGKVMEYGVPVFRTSDGTYKTRLRLNEKTGMRTDGNFLDTR